MDNLPACVKSVTSMNIIFVPVSTELQELLNG